VAHVVELTACGEFLPIASGPRDGQRWTMPVKNWSAAMNQFAILFEGRVPMGGLGSN
jgi:hypothetical protein